MKRKSLFANLEMSVTKQTVEARDKFDIADLTMAMKRAVLPSGQQEYADGKTLDAANIQDGNTSVISMTETSSIKPVSAPPVQSLQNLAIADVNDHPRNARHLYDPARIDEMAASIARDGQMMPAIVMADPQMLGKYLLIEGRYRKRALQNLGRDTITAIVVDALPELEAYRLSLILNEERNQQTDLDNALSWKLLQDDGLFRSQDHIAEYLGITQSKVSKTLSLLDLPTNVITIMKTSPKDFGLRIGYELKQLSRHLPATELEVIAEQVKEGKLTVAALEKLRTRGERPAVTRERSRAYPLKLGELTIGMLRDFDDGRLKIDLSGVTPELRQRVVTAMHKLLNDQPEQITQ